MICVLKKQLIPDIKTPTITGQRFAQIISDLMTMEPTPQNPPLFIYKRYPLAAAHNTRILEPHGFLALEKVIRNQHPSQISYGSEFRSSATLEELFQDHLLWPRLKDIRDNGVSFPLMPISEVQHKEDLNFHATRGNH